MWTISSILFLSGAGVTAICFEDPRWSPSNGSTPLTSGLDDKPDPVKIGPQQSGIGTIIDSTQTTLTIQLKNSNEVLVLTMRPFLLGVGRPTSPNEAITYQLADVKVRDIIHVSYMKVNDVYVCSRIQIHRRPGGTIPPRKEEAERIKAGLGSERAWHLHAQAYQDWEEKGTPIPEIFLPKRKVGEPVFAEGVLSRPYPILAPMPREVLRKP